VHLSPKRSKVGIESKTGKRETKKQPEEKAQAQEKHTRYLNTHENQGQ
jgi:hypothetical protein